MFYQLNLFRGNLSIKYVYDAKLQQNKWRTIINLSCVFVILCKIIIRERDMINKKMHNICIFCGSKEGHNPHYSLAANIIGKKIAEENIGLVYGGGKIGLMGIIAHTVVSNGGYVTGIIPKSLCTKEIAFNASQELIITENMHERKSLMYDKADAFIALPGGIGTLEELVEQITWAQIYNHKKPIILMNIDNFWAPLLNLLSHMNQEGFMRGRFDDFYQVINDAHQVIPTIQEQLKCHE